MANLVDEMGGALVHVEGLPMNVSVDMSISYLSPAKLDVNLLHLLFHVVNSWLSIRVHLFGFGCFILFRKWLE